MEKSGSMFSDFVPMLLPVSVTKKFRKSTVGALTNVWKTMSRPMLYAKNTKNTTTSRTGHLAHLSFFCSTIVPKSLASFRGWQRVSAFQKNMTEVTHFWHPKTHRLSLFLRQLHFPIVILQTPCSIFVRMFQYALCETAIWNQAASQAIKMKWCVIQVRSE